MRRKISNSDNLYIDENGLITREDGRKYDTEYTQTQKGSFARLELCNKINYYESELVVHVCLH